MSDAFAPFATRMRDAGQPDLATKTFSFYYEQLRRGETGLLPESAIAPVETLPDAEALGGVRDAGARALSKAVVIKLNGGLGTSMGMTRAKSLLTVKDGLSFLDIIARQILRLRATTGSELPLVLMNSFRTRDDSLAALARHDGLDAGLPLDFVQHKVPKILVDGLSPATHPTDEDHAWCPPGHGDLYTALVTSGMLAKLRARGLKYAFVSNADNLGAVLDVDILGHFASHDLPFLMEVADRTEADRKGGHLAQRPDGGLTLRESAQCPADDLATFQDHTRHRYFNTNNLWIDLDALAEALDARGDVLGLPMIRNEKHLDPADPTTPAVYQLETAMGAAISVFDGAGAIRVPRSRFAPVKTTNDLLGLWSDVYRRTDDERVVMAPERRGRPPIIDLDKRHYKLIGGLEARFPHGAPSLARCDRLTVVGDVTFGRDVVIEGDVRIVQAGASPHVIPDGTVFSGDA